MFVLEMGEPVKIVDLPADDRRPNHPTKLKLPLLA